MKKVNKKKLTLDCPEFELQKSLFSEFGPEGLTFLQAGLKVLPAGILSDHEYSYFDPSSLTIGEEIGRGNSCTVYEGVLEGGQKVAVKSINILDRERRHQLMKDIGTLVQLKHQQFQCPFIVKLHGAFYEDNSVKVILQHMDWGSLKDFSIKLNRQGKKISDSQLADIALQCLSGLSYLHCLNQLHRDIKPQNILINTQGQLKLTDFGIAKQLQHQELANTFVGTYSYMSPQRIQGMPYSSNSDIWSLGMVLAQLALGRYPYSSKNFIQTAAMVTQGPPQLFDLTEEAEEFLSLFFKNFRERPSAIWLAGHPFILRNLGVDSLKSLL